MAHRCAFGVESRNDRHDSTELVEVRRTQIHTDKTNPILFLLSVSICFSSVLKNSRCLGQSYCGKPSRIFPARRMSRMGAHSVIPQLLAATRVAILPYRPDRATPFASRPHSRTLSRIENRPRASKSPLDPSSCVSAAIGVASEAGDVEMDGRREKRAALASLSLRHRVPPSSRLLRPVNNVRTWMDRMHRIKAEGDYDLRGAVPALRAFVATGLN
jgi:hypothetical protein